MAPNSVRACRSQFCKLQDKLPSDPKLGFNAPKRIAHPIDVAPTVSRFAGPFMTPRERRGGLSIKQDLLLREMQARADAKGMVKISFNDVFADIQCSTPSCVSPLMKALEAMGRIVVVARPGGRAKTTYRLTPGKNRNRR